MVSIRSGGSESLNNFLVVTSVHYPRLETHFRIALLGDMYTVMAVITVRTSDDTHAAHRGHGDDSAQSISTTTAAAMYVNRYYPIFVF